ncbi:MAG: hypothetical protein CMH82_03765 [Nocardioides sp.]|nr:hypothetical protein [Nocardioides sp.]
MVAAGERHPDQRKSCELLDEPCVGGLAVEVGAAETLPAGDAGMAVEQRHPSSGAGCLGGDA